MSAFSDHTRQSCQITISDRTTKNAKLKAHIQILHRLLWVLVEINMKTVAGPLTLTLGYEPSITMKKSTELHIKYVN